MPAETTAPLSFADLVTSPAYPTWAKPEPADKPTRHRKTYTYLRSLMANWDRVKDAAISAAYCHGSQTAPDDALDLLGETYGGLARALRDSPSTYRAYLRAPLDRWYTFGTKLGMVAELAHLGYRAEVVSWRDMVDAGAAPGNVVFGGNVNFFYVALFAPNSLTNGYTYWAVSRARWKTTGARWGASPNQTDYIAELRRVIALVKPAHTSCRHIVVFRDTISGLNALKLPFGNYFVVPCNEPWERIRPSYAFNPYYIQNPLVP
jgi:hypothetical protein